MLSNRAESCSLGPGMLSPVFSLVRLVHLAVSVVDTWAVLQGSSSSSSGDWCWLEGIHGVPGAAAAPLIAEGACRWRQQLKRACGKRFKL